MLGLEINITRCGCFYAMNRYTFSTIQNQFFKTCEKWDPRVTASNDVWLALVFPGCCVSIGCSDSFCYRTLIVFLWEVLDKSLAVFPFAFKHSFLIPLFPLCSSPSCVGSLWDYFAKCWKDQETLRLYVCGPAAVPFAPYCKFVLLFLISLLRQLNPEPHNPIGIIHFNPHTSCV